MECFRLPLEHLACIEHQCLRGISDSRKAGSLLGMMKGVRGGKMSIHHDWLAKGLGLKWEILCWGFKGVLEGQTEQIHSQTFDDLFFFDSTGMIYVGRGKHYSNRVSGISTRTMHQSTTPSLSQTIWPRWASTQFITLLIVQTFLPMIFCYSISSEAVVMRELRWKRLWPRSLTRSHKRTSMRPSRSCWNGTSSAL